MRDRAKVIKLIIMLIVTAFTTIMVTFAWFIAIDKTEPIIIESGTLRLNASLYIGKDTNNDEEIGEDEYVLVTDELKHLTNVLPGSVYYFKLVIENEGSVPGHLSVDIIGIKYGTNNIMDEAFNIVFLDPITTNPVDKSITGGELNLFSEKVIAKTSVFSFYFNIVGSQNISSEMAGQSMKLTSFLVTLNQIRPS